MLAPLSDDHPPAEIVALPALDVLPSGRELSQHYALESQTPTTVMDPYPLRSTTSEIVGLREPAGETTAIENAATQSTQAAGLDDNTTRGDGRHEGG
jgi:hypothetical protein